MSKPRWRAFLDRSRFQARIWQAMRAGPPFRSRLDRIIIDLTHECDLACLDCNRSCGAGQAPAAESIGLEQVRRFVAESADAGKRWRRIMLEGGEPTLHPQLDEIIAELQRYRRSGQRIARSSSARTATARGRQRCCNGMPAACGPRIRPSFPARRNGISRSTWPRATWPASPGPITARAVTSTASSAWD